MLVKAADDAWAGITEANLTDYAGMYVKAAAAGGTALISSLAPLPDSSGVCVRTSIARSTPWRVIMIADDRDASSSRTSFSI